MLTKNFSHPNTAGSVKWNSSINKVKQFDNLYDPIYQQYFTTVYSLAKDTSAVIWTADSKHKMCGKEIISSRFPQTSSIHDFPRPKRLHPHMHPGHSRGPIKTAMLQTWRIRPSAIVITRVVVRKPPFLLCSRKTLLGSTPPRGVNFHHRCATLHNPNVEQPGIEMAFLPVQASSAPVA